MAVLLAGWQNGGFAIFLRPVRISPAVLNQLLGSFDPAFLARGWKLRANGRVREVSSFADDGADDQVAFALAGRVQGSQPAAYEQHIEVSLQPGALKVRGHCSCPVGYNCKHVAAVVLAWAGGQAVPPIASSPLRLAPAPPETNRQTFAERHPPVFCLTLCLRLLDAEAFRGARGRGAALHPVAIFSVRYGAHDLFNPGQPPEHVALEAIGIDDVMRTLQRDLHAEQRALGQLGATGGLLRVQDWELPLQPAPESEPAILASCVFTCISDAAWLRVLDVALPELRAQGWQVRVTDDFPFDVADPSDWVLDIDASGNTPWFEIGLDVEIDGQRMPLAPMLAHVIEERGWPAVEMACARPDGHLLAPMSADKARAGVLRFARLPVARIRPLLRLIREWMQAPAGRARIRVSRFDLGMVATLAEGCRINGPVDLERTIRQVRKLDGLPAVAISSRVKAKLRPYQRDGVAWLNFLRGAGLHGILADDMGLGKTLQTLALLAGEFDAERVDLPSLVVAPTSVVSNWAGEAQRFVPDLHVCVLSGSDRIAQLAQIRPGSLVITSYAIALRDAATLRDQDWHYVILDEAHRIKNARGLGTRALKSLRARHRLCLTGTPLENHLGELWSLADFLMPGLLGDERTFRAQYRTPIEKKGDQLAGEMLARRLKPVMLRRTKQQVASELPPRTEQTLWVELEDTQRDLYEAVRLAMDKKVRAVIAGQGFARSQIMMLEALLKLRQICCDPRLIGQEGGQPSAKLQLLRELLPTLLAAGRRVIVFSQFAQMLALIEEEVRGWGVPYAKLTGQTTDRDAEVALFREGTVPLFLITLKAGGVGLNLTAADTVILYDPWWNPAAEQQAADRAHRLGQRKPVTIYRLIARGTVEEKILEMQARKAGLADQLLAGALKDTQLTEQDFEALLAPLRSA